MTSYPLTAAILVGGQSRRMGRDKALLTLEPGGPAIVEMVAAAVGEVADEVFLVGSLDAAILPHLPRIADRYPGTGALGGIYAALATARHDRVLVVACDMPFLTIELLRNMAGIDDNYDVLVPVVDRPHPLHAIYNRSCLPHIERELQAGRNKVTGWFDRVTVREIDRETVARHDPDLLSTFNMNTPEDFRFAQAEHARRSSRSSSNRVIDNR